MTVVNSLIILGCIITTYGQTLPPTGQSSPPYGQSTPPYGQYPPPEAFNGKGCYANNFSVVISHLSPACQTVYHGRPWENMTSYEIIKELWEVHNSGSTCLDEVKSHLDKLNTTKNCTDMMVETAEEIKVTPNASLELFAAIKHLELEVEMCFYCFRGYGSYPGYYDPYYGGGHYDDGACPFSLVVNATNKASCNFDKDTMWDKYNTSELLKAIHSYSDDCIDELKAHLDKLNSTCLINYTATADELKSIPDSQIDAYALRKALDYGQGCQCGSYKNGYGGGYYGSPYPGYYDPYYGGGHYSDNDGDCPFSLVVNATNKASCNFHTDIMWDKYNTSDLIKAIHKYSDDCIDELKANLDKLNSTCLLNYTATADELKSIPDSQIDAYALQKEQEFERCQCGSGKNRGYGGGYYGSPYPGYYDPYYGGGHYSDNDGDCPFSLVVNATNKASCNFHTDIMWDKYNTSDLIKAIHKYSDDCIDELKANLDKLNSTCLINYTATADELKSIPDSQIDAYALQKEQEFERCQCGSGKNRGYGGGYYSSPYPGYYDPYYGGGHYSDNDGDCPFSLVVNATNKASCNFHTDIMWDKYNTSDLIKAIHKYSDDCIDELKANLDKLNSTCLLNYTATADELKSIPDSQIDAYALQKEQEFERCQCGSGKNRGYGGGYYSSPYPGYYDPYYGGGHYSDNDGDCPFSLVVNATNKASCNFHTDIMWDKYNTSDLIKAIHKYSDDCIDELKANLDKLNSTCLINYTATADELKTIPDSQIDAYALQKEQEFERCQCGSGKNRGYGGGYYSSPYPGYYDPYYGGGHYSDNDGDCPFSLVVNATNKASCNFHTDIMWDKYNTSDLIKAIHKYSDDCIDELKAHLDKLNSTCLINYTATADELKTIPDSQIDAYALQKEQEFERCQCGSGKNRGSLSRSPPTISGSPTGGWYSHSPPTGSISGSPGRSFSHSPPTGSISGSPGGSFSHSPPTGSISGSPGGSPSNSVPSGASRSPSTVVPTSPAPTCQPITCPHVAECSGCGTSTCWAYDATLNDICSSNIPGWTTTHQTAWNDFQSRRAALPNDTVVVKSFLAKCGNLEDLASRYATVGGTIKDAFFKLARDAVVPDNIDDIPVELIVLLEETRLSSVLASLSFESKLRLLEDVENVRGTYRCEMREILKKQNLDFTTIFEDAVNANSLSPTNEAFFNGGTCNHYITDDCTIQDFSRLLRYAPPCLEKRSKCIHQVSQQTVLNAAADIQYMCEQYSGYMPPNIQGLLEDVPYLFSSAPTCTTDWLDMTIACEVDPGLVSNCDYSQLNPKDISSASWKFKTAYSRLKADKLLTSATYSSLDAAQIKSIGCGLHDSEFLELDPAALKDAVCNDNLFDELRQEMRESARYLLTSSPGITIDDTCMDIIVPGYLATTADAATLMAKFASGGYNDVYFESDKVTTIVDKIKTSVTSTSVLMSTKSVAAYLPSETFASLSGDFDRTEIIELAAQFSSSSEVCSSKKKAVVSKMLSSANGLSAVMESDLVTEVPVSAITGASISDLPFLSANNASSVTLTSTQASACWEVVLSEYGSVDADYLINHDSIVGAVPKNVLAQMTYTSNIQKLQVLSSVAESDVVNSEMGLYVATEAAAVIASEDVSSLDPTEISGAIFQAMSLGTLNLFSNPLTVVSQMKTNDPSLYGIREARNWGVKTFIKNVLGIGSGASVQYSSAAELGNNTMLLDDTDFAYFTADSIKYVLEVLKDRYVCRAIVKKVVDRYVAVALTGSVISTVAELEFLGSFAIELDLSSVPTTILKDAAQALGISLKLRNEDRAKRRRNGFRNECDDDDIDDDEAEFQSRQTTLFTGLIDAFIGQTTVGRRRRSTSSLTCAQMQLLGTAGLTAMTTAQIAAMADSDFLSCASLLGGVSGYTSDQETALADVAKRATVWGDPSTWSSSNIQQAGVIVQALSTAEIQSMTWVIDDVSRMGDFDGWDETKKVAIVSTWLSSVKSNDASTITASELQSLSHMTCGLSTAQISALTTYSSAADSVGEVTSCTEQQMVEFANLAKIAYTNNVASWSSVQIAAVGVHIGGLSKTEMGTLTETQIDNILAAHITYIPSTAFSGFTTTQIGTFSTAQAQSTTSVQRSALSSAQLSALETVAGISYSSTTSDDSGGSSAGSVTVSLVGILTCMMAIFVNAVYIRA